MAMTNNERQMRYYNENRVEINMHRRKMYAEKLKAGLCPRCGFEPDDKDYKLCGFCRLKMYENNERSKRERGKLL